VQASIGQYVVRQDAGTIGGIHTSEKVSVTGKESSKYALHNSTANHMQSALTQTANMKGNAGSINGWSKDRVEKNPGPQEDETARPAVSAYQRTESRTKGRPSLTLSRSRRCVTAKTAFARQGGAAGRHTICSGQ